jgi:hypothetical protein
VRRVGELTDRTVRPGIARTVTTREPVRGLDEEGCMPDPIESFLHVSTLDPST